MIRGMASFQGSRLEGVHCMTVYTPTSVTIRKCRFSARKYNVMSIYVGSNDVLDSDSNVGVKFLNVEKVW